MTQLAPRSSSLAATTPAPPSRAVVVWALVGLVWVAVCVNAVVGWVTSDDFGPAPILPGDEMSGGKLVGLRVLEVISVAVLAVSFWYLALRPWLRTRHVRLDALLFLGGLTAFFMDSWLNLYDYLFAFNANSVNLGAWSASLPFHNEGVPTGYGEALLWGLPMYIYFCAALGAVGAACARRLLARGLSMQATLAILWVGDFVFDFVVENVIIRTTDAYSFVRTEAGLTLWDGSQYQFPIYESICVAFVGLGFTYVRLSADRSPDGLSLIERGTHDLPARLQLPMRALAAIGYCAVVLMFAYHLPFNWISIGGDSFAQLPSYLLPG